MSRSDWLILPEELSDWLKSYVCSYLGYCYYLCVTTVFRLMLLLLFVTLASLLTRHSAVYALSVIAID